MSLRSLYLIPFLFYLLLLITIAYYSRKKAQNSSHKDLLLADRKINFWVTALSAQASDMSSWLFMAFPMSIYMYGAGQMWVILSLILGMYATWKLVAPKLRDESEKTGAMTVTSFFSARFHDPKRHTALVASIFCVIFMIHYISAGMISTGFLFESMFGFSYTSGILFATCVILTYVFLGGLMSVAWADMFQALFLLAAIIIVPCQAIWHMGGLNQIITIASTEGLSLNPFNFSSIPWQELICTLFGWGLGYLGMPQIVTIFMAIDNTKNFTKSTKVGLIWQTIALLAAALCGVAAIGFFTTPLENPELVFIEMAKQLLSPLFASFVLCGIIAATLSTMNAQLLVSSSIASTDILRRWKKVNFFNQTTLFRISVLLITTCSFCIALRRNSTIMETVYYSWAGLGSTFSPAMLAALYLPNLPWQAACGGIISGGLVSGLWPFFNPLLTYFFSFPTLPALIPGFIANTFVILLTGFFMKRYRLKQQIKAEL